MISESIEPFPVNLTQPLSARPNPLSRYYEMISLPKPDHAKTKQHELIVGVTQKSGHTKILQAIAEDGQTISFCGPEAHHQNGVTKRAIQTIISKARTMMVHADAHWPEEFDKRLWPFAMDYASHLWNRTPRMDGSRAPLEKLLNIDFKCNDLLRARVWGCPAYFLESAAKKNSSLVKKWDHRAKVAQSLGFNKLFSSSVGLVWNIETESITTQFQESLELLCGNP